MRNKLFSLLLLFVIALNAVGQQGAGKSQPSVDRLRSIVTFLASDKLDGRRTGTEGANLAARYIATEFKRVGLKPGANGYWQTFPYVSGVDLGGNNSLAVKPNSSISAATLRVRDDWMPLGVSSNSTIDNAQVVFVKHGITAKELNHDDYASLDVKDKIAVALDGTPDGDNPHGQFVRYADPRWKAIAAKDKGAKALVLISQTDKFSDDRLSELRYDNAGEAGLPIIVVGKAASLRLFGDKQTEPQSYAGSFWSLTTDVTRRETPASNVIGILEGSDSRLKSETIVIGAHYDHLGRGGEGSLAPKAGDIHHGADDNASGVAGVLELARIFSIKEMRPKRTIVFIAFSGEEEGLIGSNFYVNHPIVPLAQTVAMINMDMIGRLKDDKLIIGGVGTSTQWREMITSTNQVTPVVKASVGNGPAAGNGTTTFSLTLNEDGYGPSDHSSFYSKQVPVLFFWTGTHEDYHKPTDTADKINYDGEARVLSMVLDVVRALDRNDQRPVYAVAKSESTGRSMGFKISLGTIPNYAETNSGVLLDGVRDDSPAAKAGLKAGDVIVKLAGRDIHNVTDYTYTMGEMKAGEEYEVELMRGTERVKLKIIPAARK